LKKEVCTEVYGNQTDHQYIIGSSCVFKIKYRPKGDVQGYYARLIAMGYTQSYGIDYLERFSPVVNMHTRCLLLVLAVSRDFQIDQMDIKTAFLGQDLSHGEKSRYMELP